MNSPLVASLLSQKIQFGQSTLPVGMVIYLLACFSLVGVLNYQHWQRYHRLMIYIGKHHPEIYEAVRRKPDVAGVGYSKGYKHIKPLLELSKRVHNFNDPKLEEMLLSFIQFDRNFTIIASFLIVFIVLVGMILSFLYWYQ